MTTQKRCLTRVMAWVAMLISVHHTTSTAETVNVSAPDRRAIVHADPAPQFPYELWRAGVETGQATLIVNIGTDGSLVDWLVVEASDRRLVPAIEEALIQWTFEPAIYEGKAISSNKRIPFLFDVSRYSQGAAQSDWNSPMNSFLNYGYIADARPIGASKPLKLAYPSELDKYPELLEQPAPALSKESLERSRNCEATFNFYIDTSGRVRLPGLAKVKGDPDPVGLLATVNALKLWRFKPLKSRGKPVVIKASQTFVFNHFASIQE